jgi:hypothetical protein
VALVVLHQPRVSAVELQGGKPRFLADFESRRLINRNSVMKTLPRLCKPVCARQPEGAAPVRVLGVLVCKSLNNREILLVSRQRRKALGKGVVRTQLGCGREPSLLRHPEPKAQKDHAFRTHLRLFSGKGAEAQGFERGQGHERTCCAEKVAAG